MEGDQVIVNGGYMRNYLHPEKKAVYAQWSNKPKTIRVSPDTEVGKGCLTEASEPTIAQGTCDAEL